MIDRIAGYAAKQRAEMLIERATLTLTRQQQTISFRVTVVVGIDVQLTVDGGFGIWSEAYREGVIGNTLYNSRWLAAREIK